MLKTNPKIVIILWIFLSITYRKITIKNGNGFDFSVFSCLVNVSGGRIAQSVEQRTENPRVPSSILGPATIFFYLNLMIFLLK